MPVTRQQSIHLRNSRRMIRGRKSACGRPEPTESAKDRCVWTEGDETALIDYITANRSKGGDGMNFDKVFWHQENVILLFLVLFTNSATMYTIWI